MGAVKEWMLKKGIKKRLNRINKNLDEEITKEQRKKMIKCLIEITQVYDIMDNEKVIEKKDIGKYNNDKLKELFKVTLNMMEEDL